MYGSFIEKEIKPKKINIIFKLIIGFLLGISLITYYNYSQFKTKALIKETNIIEIKSGETIKNLGEKLGLNNIFLKIYLKNNTTVFELLVGKFKIEEGSNIEEILESLQNPIIEKEVNITFLEGWNIYDIDYSLNQKGYINSGEYIAYVNNPEKINKLGEFFDFLNNQETLEGFLYPDTYKINSTALKINELVIKQLENFEEKVYNKILKDLSIDEINNLVNLSSIVEKEEKNVNEKSTVAGILKKRLENGWMIGADITVCYPHELTSQECKMVISKYINEKSEYNTRTKTGLPKTPIGNPSFETINATLNYKETPYWFYLHNVKTGKIYYGKTNSDHEYNKQFMY